VQETVLKYSEKKQRKEIERRKKFPSKLLCLSSFGTEFKAHCAARLENKYIQISQVR